MKSQISRGLREGALALASALLVGGAAPGCSSGSGDGQEASSSAGALEPPPAGSCTRSTGGTAVTSLCGAAPLETLTGTEALQLCNDTSAYIAASITRATGCKYAGIIAAASNSSPTEAQLQASCAATESTCNQDDSVARPGDNTLCSQIPSACAATVEQYSACIEDEAARFEQGASELLGCSQLTFGNLSTAYDVPTAAIDVESCRAVRMGCPGFSLPYIN